MAKRLTTILRIPQLSIIRKASVLRRIDPQNLYFSLFRSLQATSLSPTRHNFGKSPARLRSSSTSLLDVANNNKIELSTPPLDTSSARRWRLSSLMGRRGWVFPCALAALSSLILPSVSHAIDLASISGGAAAAVANTNSIMSSLAETGTCNSSSLNIDSCQTCPTSN